MSCRVAICACIVLTVARAQEPPSYGAFAFPNLTGDKLISVADPPPPSDIRTAICGNRRIAVKFESQQPERPDHNGRQSPQNFDWMAGSVFRITQGAVSPDDKCYLATETLLSVATLLGPTQPSESCPKNVERIQAARARAVVHCWPLRDYSQDRHALLVEFEREQMDSLASIVMVDRQRLIFADYPARGDGQSRWRVDDDGVISGRDFVMVLLLQRGSNYILGVDWLGAEGSALSLWVSGKDDRFTQVQKDYWYRAPL